MLKIEENISLKDKHTFGCEVSARYFSNCTSMYDLKEALEFAEINTLEVFILGGGSNLLFLKDFPGLIIQINISGIEIIEDTDTYSVYKVGAGENWDLFVEEMVGRGLSGLENLSFIPGTIGGAAVQNIGAYGQEISSIIESVNVFDRVKGGEVKIEKKDLVYGYRDSIFKHNTDRYIVLSVIFNLPKEFVPNLSYSDLKYMQDFKVITSAIVRKNVGEIRAKKFPDLNTTGTAGSFFMNPIVEATVAQDMQSKYPDIPCYDVAPTQKKLSAAYILDKICNLKGYGEGFVQLYQNQPLVVTNIEFNAIGSEISSFIAKVKDTVFQKTGIKLESEVITI